MTKMNKVLVILLTILQLGVAYSQTPGLAYSKTIDSFKKVLQSEKEDTNKVNTLNKLSYTFLANQKCDSALLIASQSLALSQKLGFKEGEGTTYLRFGYGFQLESKFDEALKYYLRALEIFKEIGNSHHVEVTYQGIMKVFTQRGDYADAVNNELNALKFSEKIGDLAFGAETRSEIGNLYDLEGNYANALENYEAAVILISKAKDSAGIAYALGSIGYEYSNMGNLVEALKADSAAFNMYRSIGPKAPDWGIALCEFLFGVYYEKVGDSLDQKGKQLESLYNYRLALYNYLHSRNYFKKTKNSRIEDIESGNSQVGRMLIKLDRFSEANKYFQDNLELFKIYPFKEELKNYHQGLASVDSAEGNYKDALAHYEKYISYRDSLNNEKSTKKTIQASLQYEFDKKQLAAKADQDKKDEEQKRIKNQQYFIIAGLALIVLSVLVIALIQLRNNRQKKKANIALEKTLSNLKATQAQLIQQEKMASLGELTAGIAHEIQNPLNFVNNFSDVNKELLEELKGEANKGNIDEVKAIADDLISNEEKINHHGKRADAIVKGMLQHSRSGTGVKELTDINKLADEYLRLAYHGFKAKEKSFNAEIKSNYDESIGKINIIPQDIGRVLLNLYNNAFYAVSEKMKSANSNYKPEVEIETRREGKKIFITVCDNGNGIPRKIVDKIFQPFFTTKPTGQGTGLGLSLSYDIIKAHGGEIKVETKEGEGTEFIIQLRVV